MVDVSVDHVVGPEVVQRRTGGVRKAPRPTWRRAKDDTAAEALELLSLGPGLGANA
jgi:hypothetical protein